MSVFKILIIFSIQSRKYLKRKKERKQLTNENTYSIAVG